MPIYEYECQKCKERTEVFQKFSDKPRTKCGTCGGRLEKVISAPAIQFKGSGWYVTDYAGKNGKDERKSSDKDKSDTASATSSDKSDTKESSPAKKNSTSDSTTKNRD